MEKIARGEAARLLGIAPDHLNILEKEGLIHPISDGEGAGFYSSDEIGQIKSRRGPSLADEAAQVGHALQNDIVFSISLLRKVLVAAASALGVYFVLVMVFALLFAQFPVQTANWLGITPTFAATSNNQAAAAENPPSQTQTPVRQTTLLNTFLRPVSTASLALVRTLRPASYDEITKRTILDTNDVLQVDTNGTVTPLHPVNIPDASLLKIDTTDQIANLNSAFVQGRQPGTNVGDLEIVGSDADTSNSSTNATTPVPIPTVAPVTTKTSNAPAASSDTSSDKTSTQTGTTAPTPAATPATPTSAVNSGVLTLTGTINQVNVSTPTGNVALSLPQNIDSGASPTFARLTLSANTNQLLFGTINIGTLNWSPTSARTITLPDISDTLVGKSTIDILTNKTLINPRINGEVTTTGLVLPSFNTFGNITGSSVATLSGFASFNGLALASKGDGFTVAGGTTSRTLKVTGADITIGSTIKPTNIGPLTVLSNGSFPLTLDAGEPGGSVAVGTGTAAAISIGRTGITNTINGITTISNLKIGNGATITKFLSATTVFDAPNSSGCGTLATVSVSGAKVGDTVVATPTPTTLGIETLSMSWNAYVSAPNVVTIRACATQANQDPASQTWRVDVWQH